MKNKLLTIAIFTLVFSACFSPEKGDEGTLIISFGGGGRGRAAEYVEWPPFGEENNIINFFYPTKFIVTLNSPTGKREESFDFEVWERYTDTKISLTVASGRWNVHIETIIHDSFLYAAGSGSVDVKAGQANSVPIEMKRKYYKIGEPGPGGGIIFHVDPEGFIMTDNGQICHYLEAARETTNCNLFSDSYPFSGPIGTEVSIGTGRNNTLLILENDPSAPAANFCRNYKGGNLEDWFLPSIGELETMSTETRQLLSSSEYADELGISPNYYFYLFNGERDSTDSDWFSTLLTLPIRAF
jgi:hypothetical protein